MANPSEAKPAQYESKVPDENPSNVAQESKPLDVNPKPKVGQPLNKRLMGFVILAVGGVLLALVYGINQRSVANDVTMQTTAAAAATDTVQAIPKTEAKTLISNLQKIPANAPGNAQPGGAANPNQTSPSSLTAPPWRPVSVTPDSGFQRSFFAPSSQGLTQGQRQGQSERAETAAEEAARLEHEALYAPLSAKKQDAVRTGAPVLSGQTAYETTAGGAPASDIEQIAALAKSLIPASPVASSNANALPNVVPSDATSRLLGHSGAPATFAESARRHSEDDSLANLRTGPLSPYEIKAGWEIPAMLEQALKSELPGELRALVTQNVRDTASGQYLLIPQGSRLVGTYNDKTTFGQGGVEVIWTRIIFPDASSLDLDGMIGQDESGQAGLRGKTDNHYGQLVGTALLTSVLSATASLANNRSGSGIGYYPSAVTAAGSGAAQSIQETGSQLTQRNLTRRPTVVVSAGTRFNVHVNKDIRFDGVYVPRRPLLPIG